MWNPRVILFLVTIDELDHQDGDWERATSWGVA
jgi:hypothetical protein